MPYRIILNLKNILTKTLLRRGFAVYRKITFDEICSELCPILKNLWITCSKRTAKSFEICLFIIAIHRFRGTSYMTTFRKLLAND